MPDSPNLALTVNVSADEWDACNRRVAYLENLLMGAAERDGLDPEWFDVERLAGLWGGRVPDPDAPIPVISRTIVPAWVLPLRRLMRDYGGDLGLAWQDLPDALPAGLIMPSPEEAAVVLIALGLT